MNPLLPIIRLLLKVFSFLLFGLTILSAFGGYINPQFWALPSVLTLGLPYLAAATFAVTIGWLLTKRFIMTAIGTGTLILCWGAIATVSPFGHARNAIDDKRVFSVLSYNILHGHDLERPDSPNCRAFDFILNSDADIVCLQELSSLSKKETTTLTDSLINEITTRYPHRIYNARKSLSCFSKYPVTTINIQDNSEDNKTYEIYKVNLPEGILHIMNVHLTSYLLNDEEKDVVKEMKSVSGAKKSLDEFKGTIIGKLKRSFKARAIDAMDIKNVAEKLNGAVILCGDFNDVPASWAYRTIKSDRFKDAFGDTNFGPMITYNQHLFFFHIDQMLYRGPIKALSLERGKIKSSDHYPIFAKFEFLNE